MALPDLDTSVGHSFGLPSSTASMITAIQEVSGLKMEQDVIELKQNTPDGKFMIKKLPGPAEGRRGHADPGPDRRQQLRGVGRARRSSARWASARKGGAIIVFDYEGNPIKRYNLTNAWPKSLEIGSLKAGDTSVLTEKLTITYEEHGRSRAADAPHASAPSSATGRRRRRPTCLRTTFEFELPRGYVDSARHRPPRRARCAWRRPATSSCRSPTTASGRTRPTSRSCCWPASSSGIGTVDRRPPGRHREPLRLRPGLPAGPLPPGQPGGPRPCRRRVPGVRQGVHGRPDRWSPGGIVTYGEAGALPRARLRRRALPLVARRDPRPRARHPGALHPRRRGARPRPLRDRHVAVPAIDRERTPYAAAGVPRRTRRVARAGRRSPTVQTRRSRRSIRSSSTNWRRGAIRRSSPRSDTTSSPARPSGTVGGLRGPGASGRSPRRRGCPSRGSTLRRCRRRCRRSRPAARRRRSRRRRRSTRRRATAVVARARRAGGPSRRPADARSSRAAR